MTGQTKKVRGLFLAALMVFSVLAMGATFTGTVAAGHGNTDLISGETYWVGQQLVYGGSLTNGNEWQVRDADTGDLISEIEVVDGVIQVDTALTGAGDFILEDPSGTQAATFEVVEQTLRVDASPERIDNDGPDTGTSFNVRSNRANYQVEVSSAGLSDDQLTSIFGSLTLNASNDVVIAGDFTGIPAGEYTITFEGHDSTASTSVDVTVVDPDAADVSFAQTVIIQERGDVMEIGLEFQGTANSAHVILGDSEDVNYEINATVTPNDAGVATLLWDTSKSTNGTHGGLVGVKEDGATLTSVNVRDGVTSVVETGEYPVSVEFQGDETDIATSVVEERSTNGVTTHTAPAGSSDPIADASSAESGNTIAVDPSAGTNGVHDWIVIRVDASGLDGYVDDAGDLWANQGISLAIVENDDTVGTNEDPGIYLPSSSDMFQAGDDEYYVAFSASELLGTPNAPDTEVGAKFDVVFTVNASHPATTESQTVLAQFEIVQGQSQFDLEGERIFVPASDDAKVTGTSTWAPGTRLSATLRSTGGQAPFTQQNKSLIVSDSGTFSGTFELGDQPEGQVFTATLRHTNAGQQQQVQGQIGELSASISFGDQVAEDAGTLVHVDQVTLSEGGFVVIREGSEDGDVIGWSSYLEAGTHSDVRIRLDEPVSDRVTLVAVAHKDTDNNMQFGFVALDGAEDGPYTADGTPITGSATVSIPTPEPTDTDTPEPTDTATPEPTDTATPEPTDTATSEPTATEEPEDTPGFGLVVALVALMAAALLAVRRDN